MTKHEAIWQEIEDRVRFGHLDIDERWRDIVGWEGHYQVSNIKRVRSLPKRGHSQMIILAPFCDRNGKLQVSLSKPGQLPQKRYVHILAAAAWSAPGYDGSPVWRGSGPMSRTPIQRADGVQYPSIRTAAKDVGVTPGCISGVLAGRRKTAGGFGWDYL
jgi:hypothetical protein